ncbi:MAG: septum formation initiator family protein [Ruminiclostridium sp.]|nr:septum formation initiator family protein [Ruminiclostridium sp.]
MLILAPLLVVALVVCVYNFISIQVEIAEKNEELSNLTSQVEEVENENKLLGRYSLEEYKIEYIETIARDKLGYAKPEERIYYIVPAD